MTRPAGIHLIMMLLVAVVALASGFAETPSVEHADAPCKGDGATIVTAPADAICPTIEPIKNILPSLAAKSTQRVRVAKMCEQINSSVVRATASTTHANRYGLYNHKILFGTSARHYYVNGLRRLII